MSTADSGQYNCVAGNVLGETSASYDLQINSSDRSYSNITQISFFLINLLWRMIELTLWRRYLHSLKYCWSQNAFTFHADIHLVSRYSSLNYCDNTMSKERRKNVLKFYFLIVRRKHVSGKENISAHELLFGLSKWSELSV